MSEQLSRGKLAIERAGAVLLALAVSFAIQVADQWNRAKNMLYEGLKENATIVIVTSTAVESMQLGGLAGMIALTMGLGQERGNGHKDVELKGQSDDTARANEILNRSLKSEILEQPRNAPVALR